MRGNVVSTRLTMDEAQALSELASRNERNVAGELRVAVRRYLGGELAEELSLETLAELSRRRDYNPSFEPEKATPLQKSAA